MLIHRHIFANSSLTCSVFHFWKIYSRTFPLVFQLLSIYDRKHMKSPLQLKNLTKFYKNLKAVDDVSFSLEEGEIFGLLGPNGAGKTTILSIISTLEKPTKGWVKIFGKSPDKMKSSVGIVPQEIMSQGFFRVEEVLHYMSGFYNIRDNTPWIDHLLEKLDLDRHRHKICSQLSGGMKRRLMIAKALVHKPKLLILDEPTAGVDIDLRTSLWHFILDLNKQGTSVLLTTHYLEEAEQLCDRVGVIDQGKLLKLGETQTLVENLTQRKIQFVLYKKMSPIANPHLVEQSDEQVTFAVSHKTSFKDLLETNRIDLANIRDIKISEGRLEEAFQQIIRGGSYED